MYIGSTTEIYMTSKKKTTTEPEIVKAAETAPATKSKTEKSKATKTTTAAKSSAATHKPATRKPVAAKAAAAAAAPASAPVAAPAAPVAKPAFEPAAYHQEIAAEAYFQWVNRGGGDGNEREDWLRAIEIVRARYE